MQLRLDIQALRGFAVLIILLYHAGIGPFAAGYLGVDIFFVISGFLITTLLIKHMEQGDFSFREFYYRRAKRLLPAAYVVLFLTTIASYFFLTVTEYNEYKHQLLGALTFTVNMVLSAQTDYFGGAAEMKPLLHFWSLAIEEQFYLFLPVCLFFLPRKWWKIAAPICVGISLLACMILVQKYPQETFYYLPTRAWELGIGCLGAIFAKELWLQKWSAKLLWPAIAVIVVLPIAPIMNLHPGPDALLVCVATLAIIMARADKLNSSVLIKPLAKIGDYSYSLYLVHWPLFAITTAMYVGWEVPFMVRVGLLFFAIVSAVILYHLIEHPIHKRSYTKKRELLAPLVASTGLLIGLVIVFGLLSSSYAQKTVDFRAANGGLSKTCAQRKEYEPLSECQTSSNPHMLVFGDSHAMHIAQGIADNFPEGIIQITRSSCAPVLSLAAYAGERRTVDWASQCIQFKEDAFKYIEKKQSVKIIVLSGLFGRYVGNGEEGVLKSSDGTLEHFELAPDTTAHIMTQTIQRFRDAGKKVVIVSSPPRMDFDIGGCLDRKLSNKPILGPNRECLMRLAVDDPHGIGGTVSDFLSKVQKRANVDVIYLSDMLCDEGTCETIIDGVPLYRDATHMSNEGSVEFITKSGLVEKIIESAK